jgi:hypothetical protein
MTSEAAVQQEIRLEASKRGITLMRNNNGACKDQTGRQIRYGLMNDSAKLNKKIKSSDLIGITPVIITQNMVGQKIGIFTAVEVKHSGWRWRGDDRELAQQKFGDLVVSKGGIFMFAQSVEDVFGG